MNVKIRRKSHKLKKKIKVISCINEEKYKDKEMKTFNFHK